jgi:hypothetical protein
MAGAFLLLIAVWALRRRAPDVIDGDATPETMANPALASARPQPSQAKTARLPAAKKKHPPLFVPDIMVARQRALFMAQAKRRQAARAAAQGRSRGRESGDEQEEEAA